MKFRSVLVGAAAVMMFAPAASALSCMRADLGQTMESAKASDDMYQILVGTFTSTPVPKTKSRFNKTGAPNAPAAPLNGIGAHTVEAWFDGKILSQDARYDRAVTRMPVDVEVSCAGSWCGGAPANGREVIAFVKARPSQAMMLEAGPCPNKIFTLAPAGKQIEKLRSCFDSRCVSEIDPRFDRR